MEFNKFKKAIQDHFAKLSETADRLCDVFLGADWYTAMPMNTKQVNTIILDNILRIHSKEFRKMVKEKQKEWRNSNAS